MSAQHHCDWCMLLDSKYMLVNVFSAIIMLQRCLNDIIMFWEQKGARLRGMSHTHTHCDSAYCCADLSHQHDVCHLKQTCTPKGAALWNIWLLSLMWWSWIMQSVSTWLVGPNPIPWACGLVHCLLTVFLYNYSPSRQNSCQTIYIHLNIATRKTRICAHTHTHTHTLTHTHAHTYTHTRTHIRQTCTLHTYISQSQCCWNGLDD